MCMCRKLGAWRTCCPTYVLFLSTNHVMHLQITKALMPEKFQSHPDLKKLSMEACMHAAQNELLPLVVVQVLFFEQARAAVAGGKVTELPSNLRALLATQGIDPSRPPPPLSSTTSRGGARIQDLGGPN
jgi:hypothetical protein